MEHPFTWYDYFVHSNVIPQHTFTALVVTGVLIAAAVLARRSVARAKDSAVPDGGLTLRNIMELSVEFITGVVDGIIGRDENLFHCSAVFSCSFSAPISWALYLVFHRPRATSIQL